MKYKRNNYIILFERFGKSRQELLQFHKKQSGIPRKELFQKTYEFCTNNRLTEQDLIDLSKQYTELNLKASRFESCFPDAQEFLSLNKNRLLFVSSSSAPDELIHVSESSGVKESFEEILGSKPGFSKGPEHIEYICQNYKLSLNEIIMVGDDEQDITLAGKAGIESLRVVRDQMYSGLNIIHSLMELKKYVT